MWYRIFGLDAIEPDLAELQQRLLEAGFGGPLQVHGDDLGWTSIEFSIIESGSPLRIDRYLTSDDELRDDLDTWAGWLETQDHDPAHQPLMQHVISTQQLITMRRPLDHADENALDRACQTVVSYLAQSTRGVWQADMQGFFSADGRLLLREY